MSYRTPVSSSPGPLALIIGTIFPALVILIELLTGLCANAFFSIRCRRSLMSCWWQAFR